MVLNGIGGRTIEEAKQVLTFDEAMLWNAYISKRGSLNTGRRVNISGAHIAAILSRAHGGKASFFDFAAYEREEEVQTDGFARAFGALKLTREQLKEHRKKYKR